MAKYQKRELLEMLLNFKAQHERFPTTQDFKNKLVAVSRKTIQRIFGSMQEANLLAEQYQRGEIKFDETPLPSPKNRTGFYCPFCGSFQQNADEYYSSLTNILSNRFINLLKVNGDIDYRDGVFDSIHAVFGMENLTMRKLLALDGELEAYDEKFRDETGMGKMVVEKRE